MELLDRSLGERDPLDPHNAQAATGFEPAGILQQYVYISNQDNMSSKKAHLVLFAVCIALKGDIYPLLACYAIPIPSGAIYSPIPQSKSPFPISTVECKSL